MIDEPATVAQVTARARLLGNTSDAPPPRTLLDIFTATAQAHPDAPAVDDGDTTLSYRELAAAAEDLADHLANANVGRR